MVEEFGSKNKTFMDYINKCMSEDNSNENKLQNNNLQMHSVHNNHEIDFQLEDSDYISQNLTMQTLIHKMN